MSTEAARPTRRLERQATPATLDVVPVKWWAGAGAALCLFMAYVLLRWVTGPYFEHVDPGPTPIPGWMKVSLVFWQTFPMAVYIVMVWWWVVRPWRRERTVTTDGLFVLAGLTLFFQDPLTNYFNTWFTYNAGVVNMGSWANDIPGWQAYGEPGRMMVEPPLFVPFCHGTVWILFAIIGSKAITWARRRWPRIGLGGLLGGTFALMAVLDIVVEGLLYVPFGVFVFPGGHGPSLFPDSYHKFPLHEALLIGVWSTAVVFLYHFRDDRGMTWVERGADRIKGGALKKGALRLLAMIAFFQIGFFVLYMVPTIGLFTSKSTTWPKDVQERSYFLDGLCGPGSDWACPGPAVPLNRGSGRNQTGVRVSPDGRLVVPEGTKFPKPVPLTKEKNGPFRGPLIR